MRPAVEPFRQALKYCTLHTPKVPVYNTIKCEKYNSPREIISMLPKQVNLSDLLFRNFAAYTLPCSYIADCKSGEMGTVNAGFV